MVILFIENGVGGFNVWKKEDLIGPGILVSIGIIWKVGRREALNMDNVVAHR